MEFENVVKERYAAKLFDGRRLPEQQVDKLLEMIRYAPYSFNIQPWVVEIISDQEIKEKLAPASWNQPQIKSCSHLLVFCANKDIAGNIDRLEKMMVEQGAKPEEVKEYAGMMRSYQPQIKSYSHLLIFCANKDIAGNIDRLEKMMVEQGAKPEEVKEYAGMMRSFEKSLSDEQKLAWAQRQAYLALGNALNGAKALGFDSCPMEGFDHAEYAKILKLAPNLVPTALCPIGYASDKPKQKIRFPGKELFVYN